MEEIQNRWNAPTPPFFKRLQYLGMVLAAAGGTLLAAPVALPAVILTAAGYAVVTGSVLAAVSQVTKD
jgi:site-specific recombinase